MWDTLMRRAGDDGDPAIRDAVIGFRALSAANDEIVARVADAHGIGASDLRAIAFIDDNTDATPSQVAAFLKLTSGATTSLLDRVQRAGYVERRAHPTDRRSIHLGVTPAGGRLVAGVRGLYLTAFTDVLGDDGAASFAADLRDLATRLHELLQDATGADDWPGDAERRRVG